MEDYKKLVKTMTEELREIRKALDEELLKQRGKDWCYFSKLAIILFGGGKRFLQISGNQVKWRTGHYQQEQH